MTIVIGVTGQARHGKSAVCEILCQEHGFTIIGFADALKRMALAIDPVIPVVHTGGQYPVTDKDVRAGATIVTARLSQIVAWSSWEKAKDDYPEVRRFLQALGTEGGRECIDPDIWVDLWEREVRKHDRVCVPDVRFLNEAIAVEGFLDESVWFDEGVAKTLWRVIRPGLVDENAGTTHASESEQAQIAVGTTLINEGTLEALSDKVRAALIAADVPAWEPTR